MTGARGETKTLLALLQRHYIKPGAFPGGVFIPECGVNGGGAGSRADALYVGFTSTSGRVLIGHELKVTRADWRRELDHSGKADFWADNCHQWFIVAPGPEIVPKEEVPHGWGLMYPNPRTTTRMQIVVKPVTHADREPSWLAVRSIMARLDTIQHGRIHQVESEALDKARERAERELRDRAARQTSGELTEDLRRRLEILGIIEQVLGHDIEVYSWDKKNRLGAETAGRALRLALDFAELGIGPHRHTADQLRREASQMLDALDAYEQSRLGLLDAVGRRAQ